MVDTSTEELYDVVIIGSGLAGSVCAKALSGSGLNALMVEQRKLQGINVVREFLGDKYRIYKLMGEIGVDLKSVVIPGSRFTPCSSIYCIT